MHSMQAAGGELLPADSGRKRRKEKKAWHTLSVYIFHCCHIFWEPASGDCMI